MTVERAGTTVLVHASPMRAIAVAVAKVKAGDKTLKTTANGAHRLAQAPAGKVKASASKPSYAPVEVRFVS